MVRLFCMVNAYILMSRANITSTGTTTIPILHDIGRLYIFNNMPMLLIYWYWYYLIKYQYSSSFETFPTDYWWIAYGQHY